MHFLLICSACACRNIVSTVNLDCKLELKSIALQARNAEYNPKVKKKMRVYLFCFSLPLENFAGYKAPMMPVCC